MCLDIEVTFCLIAAYCQFSLTLMSVKHLACLLSYIFLAENDKRHCCFSTTILRSLSLFLFFLCVHSKDCIQAELHTTNHFFFHFALDVKYCHLLQIKFNIFKSCIKFSLSVISFKKLIYMFSFSLHVGYSMHLSINSLKSFVFVLKMTEYVKIFDYFNQYVINIIILYKGLNSW